MWFLTKNIRRVQDLVVITFGQSNESGYDYDYVNVGNYNLNNPDFLIYVKPNVTNEDNGNFEIFDVENQNNQNPINKPTNKSHGCEFSLGNEITKLGKKIHFIKFTGGATQITPTTIFDTGWGTYYPWALSGLPYYKYLVNYFVKPALSKLTNPKIIAIIMHQGESESNDINAYPHYHTYLSYLWKYLKSDLPLNNARKYICLIAGSSWPYVDEIRTHQQQFISENTAFIGIETNDLDSNGVHLTMAAQEIKGLRIFNDLKNYL